MAHRLPLADIQFISDFAVYARSRGDVSYSYCDAATCALAQFLRDTGRIDLAEQPCGVTKPYGLNWFPARGTPLVKALNCGNAYTFSALASRLERLIVDAPVLVSQP